MSIFWYLGFFLLALGVLIVVHELGHYSAARLCGVKVLRFSVGFGHPLVTRRFGADRTEWSIGLFPLGGYVKMLDEREGFVSAAERARAFNVQPVRKRFFIVLAGPLANFLLAIAVYFGVFVGGVDELQPVIDTPAASTRAAAAGLVGGDRVVRIDGAATPTWQAVRLTLLERVLDGSEVSLVVVSESGVERTVKMDVSTVDRSNLERDVVGELGLIPQRAHLPPVIGTLVPGGVADKAGLQVGDALSRIDGKPVAHWAEVVGAVRAAPGRSVVVEYTRAGQAGEVTLVPAVTSERGASVGRIGVGPQITGPGPKLNVVRVVYGPLEALNKALATTWDATRLSLSVMWKMVTGAVSWRNLSGPVTIADYAGQTAAIGWGAYIRFIALVSISLGVMNLMPLPVLDGGHLMYYVAEIVKGSPVSDKAMEVGQKIGFALLMMLMAFAFYNDINRLISG